MERFECDPRKLIAGPSWPCPACHRPALGTLGIYGRTIEKCCRKCLHRVNEQLPPPKLRRIIYLDQFVYSNIAKSLDPVWRAERGAQAELWTRLFNALDRALKLHLIVCPESCMHYDESIVHPHFSVLSRLYEHFAAGTSFYEPEEIHGKQLRLALDARLTSERPDFRRVSGEDVIDGSLAAWMERISVKVRLIGARPGANEVRQDRDKTGEAMRAIFERRKHERLSFTEAYQIERRGLAQATLQRLITVLSLGKKQESDEQEWTAIRENLTPEVRVAIETMSRATECGLSNEEAFKSAVSFLFSEEALSAPMNEIGSLLMAALAGRATMGQKRVPDRGMWNDIEAISAFLPYCGAMFVDNECANLLADRRIASKLGFCAKIFSQNNAEEFLVYLRSLEEEAGREWVGTIHEIYGAGWTKPFRSMLETERDRVPKHVE